LWASVGRTAGDGVHVAADVPVAAGVAVLADVPVTADTFDDAEARSAGLSRTVTTHANTTITITLSVTGTGR
jgi:hypothetical protein